MNSSAAGVPFRGGRNAHFKIRKTVVGTHSLFPLKPREEIDFFAVFLWEKSLGSRPRETAPIAMAEVPGLVAKMAAAGDDPDAVAALQNALQGLGAAYVEFGKAILAIDVKKAAGGADGSGKKKKVDPCAVPVRLPTPRTL